MKILGSTSRPKPTLLSCLALHANLESGKAAEIFRAFGDQLHRMETPATKMSSGTWWEGKKIKLRIRLNTLVNKRRQNLGQGDQLSILEDPYDVGDVPFEALRRDNFQITQPNFQSLAFWLAAWADDAWGCATNRTVGGEKKINK